MTGRPNPAAGMTRTCGRATCALALTVAVLAAPCANAAPPITHDSPWFTAWSRPQSVAAAAAADPADGGRGPGPLLDQSVRNIVRVTGGGSTLRLRLSNRYGA